MSTSYLALTKNIIITTEEMYAQACFTENKLDLVSLFIKQIFLSIMKSYDHLS